MKMISVNDISFFFGDSSLEIIDDVSFDVNKGEFVSIIGPSGCGKSTLLRIIAGLVYPKRRKGYGIRKGGNRAEQEAFFRIPGLCASALAH